MTIQQTLLGSSGTVNWFTKPTSGSISVGNSGRSGITVDSSNNLFMTLGFGGGAYKSIAKLNSNGEYQWLSTSVGDGTNYIGAGPITTDSSGNVYWGGDIQGYNNALICKLNSSGTIQWTYLFSNGATATVTYVQGIRVDSSGNVYVLLRRSSGGYDGGTSYLIKLNSSGSIVWQVAMAGATLSPIKFFDCYGLGIDSFNNLYVCGSVQRSGATSAYTSMLIKFNSSGTVQWQKYIELGAIYSGSAYCLFVDANDNIFIGGYMDSISFSGYSYVAKVSSSGTFLGACIFSPLSLSGLNAFYSITGDSSGTIYAASSNGYIIALNGANLNGFSPVIWANTCYIGAYSSTLGPICETSSNNFFIQSDDGVYGPFIGLLPNNGTKTGTYTVGSYNNIYTLVSAPATSTISYTTGSTSLTYGTSTFSTSSYTSTGSNSTSFTTVLI